MDGWIRDLKFGARSLMRAPGFTVVAVLTIALGIGANTAIFSVVEAVLLRPLPYATPDRLVTVMSEMRNRGVEDFPLSPPTFLDLQDGAPGLEWFAGVSTFQQPLAGEGGAPMQLDAAFVTRDFFRVFGVQPALGRDFTDTDVVLGNYGEQSRLYLNDGTGTFTAQFLFSFKRQQPGYIQDVDEV